MKWRIRSQILRKKLKTFLRRNMQVTAHLEKQVIPYWEERRKLHIQQFYLHDFT